MIRCSSCHDGTMIEGHVQDYDARVLFAMDQPVILGRAPALVCDRCGTVMLTGEVIEAAETALATLLVEQGGDLRPKEVRFLRVLLGMSQAALAARLETTPAAVAQWESDEAAPGGLPSLVLRSLVAWHLLEKDPALAVSFSERFMRAPAGRVDAPYRLERVAA